MAGLMTVSVHFTAKTVSYHLVMLPLFESQGFVLTSVAYTRKTLGSVLRVILTRQNNTMMRHDGFGIEYLPRGLVHLWALQSEVTSFHL